MVMGDISPTADIWPSDSLDPYLAVTAHWIGQDKSGTCKLHFKSALITLHYVPGSHTGAALAKTFLYLIDCTGISLDKVSNSYIIILLHHQF